MTLTIRPYNSTLGWYTVVCTDSELVSLEARFPDVEFHFTGHAPDPDGRPHFLFKLAEAMNPEDLFWIYPISEWAQFGFEAEDGS